MPNITFTKNQWGRISEISGNGGLLVFGSVVIPFVYGILVLQQQGSINIKMITFNVDNLTLFYLGMSMVALTFAILVAFGRTEEKKK